MCEIQKFSKDAFGELRAIEDENGNPWFVAKDVAVALGYANPNDAIKRHCKGVVKHYPLQTAGGIQQVRFITEGDMYRLVASSKLDAAVEFESWVFDEVIPSIRKHGMYATPQSVEEMLADPDTMIRTLQALKDEREKVAEQKAQIKAMEPKALFADAVVTSNTSILVGELAKILKQNGFDIGQNRLFELLRKEGYLIGGNRSDRNMPTQKSMELGLFEIKERTVTNPDGTVRITKTPKVSGRGQIYFVNRYCGKRGGDE